MSNIHHPPGCTCGAHNEKEYGLSRRQALKSLGALGAGLTLGPTVALGSMGDPQRRD